MKIFLHTVFDIVITFALATILAFIFTFGFSSNIHTNYLLIMPIIMFVRLYMVNSKLIPMQDKIDKLEKDNKEKDNVIYKFLKMNEVE